MLIACVRDPAQTVRKPQRRISGAVEDVVVDHKVEILDGDSIPLLVDLGNRETVSGRKPGQHNGWLPTARSALCRVVSLNDPVDRPRRAVANSVECVASDPVAATGSYWGRRGRNRNCVRQRRQLPLRVDHRYIRGG